MKVNFFRIIAIAMVSSITIINYLKLSSNKAIGGDSSWISVLIATFCVISIFVLIYNYKTFLGSAQIVKVVVCYGFIVVLSILLNNKEYRIFHIINILTEQTYWIMTFLIAYLIVRRDMNSKKILYFLILLSFPFLVYSYANIALFYNYFLAFNYQAINESYYLLCFLPFFLMSKSNIIKYTGVISIVVALLFSVKRTGNIALVLSLAIYFSFYIFTNSETVRVKYTRYIYMGLFLILSFYSIDYFNVMTNYYLIERFEIISIDEGSGRYDIWLDTINKIRDMNFMDLVVGNGYNAVLQSSVMNSAHNDFLEVLYDYGLPALFIYSMIYFYLFKYWRNMHKTKYIYANAFLASIVIFVVLSSFSHLVIYPSYFIYITIFWGVIISSFETYQFKLKSN